MTAGGLVGESAATFAVAGAPVAVRITPCAPGIVRIRLGEPDSGSSYLEPRDWPPLAIAARLPQAIDTGAIVVAFVADPPALELRDRAGRPRLRLGLDAVALQPRLRLQVALPGEQHLYGLGQCGLPFDRLGAARRLWNCHVDHSPGAADIAIPLLLSQLGHGLFFDHAGPAWLGPGDALDTASLGYACNAPGLDLYYLAGEDLRATLAEAATLLGRAPLPPRWALGYLQSTRHFVDTDELRRLAATFRDKQLPCDALVLLSSYGDALGWNRGVGHLDWQQALVPRSRELLAELHELKFRVVTHEYPVLHPGSPLAVEARDRGYLLDETYPRVTPTERPSTSYHEGQPYLDFTRPEIGEWWWQAHRPLRDDGVDGWWLDGGDGPSSDPDNHNRYDLRRQQAFADGEARDRPERRPFLLCRSGGPGMQRFGAACWSGDVDASFATLEAQLGLGLNVGLAGVPYWGTDIGGFYPGPASGGELFARWFQFGAFCPIFRAHGRAWRNHLPWAHGAAVEAICRRYLELRQSLMPYTYSLAWQAHRLGLPLMRPLVLNYPDDRRTWDLGSQYLWGDDILVAPVTRAGATHWPVYLPAGTWHDFWTHDSHAGPADITVPAPLYRLPLFVRAGAIVPTGPVRQHDGAAADSALTLLVYPAGRSAFALYEDDGLTNEYRSGRCAVTDFECLASGDEVTCRIAAPRGDTGLVAEDRPYILRIHAPSAPRSVMAAGAGGERREPSWRHDGGHFLTVHIIGHPTTISMVW
jgi:alpha-glucosidase (family GH31 glycosyl hydrolase)